MMEPAKFDDDLLENFDSYEAELRTKYGEAMYNKITTLGSFLTGVGLTLEESCILSRLDPEWVKAEMAANSALNTFVRVRTLVLKAKLLRIITNRAITSKDEKTATWILEERYPEEFKRKPGGTKNTPASPGDGGMAGVLDAVRDQHDDDPAVQDVATLSPADPLPKNDAGNPMLA